VTFDAGALHEGYLFVPIGAADLDIARGLMRGDFGGGPATIREIAAYLHVLPRDLDLALWRSLGRPR
jgi:hypothetical protein